MQEEAQGPQIPPASIDALADIYHILSTVILLYLFLKTALYSVTASVESLRCGAVISRVFKRTVINVLRVDESWATL